MKSKLFLGLFMFSLALTGCGNYHTEVISKPIAVKYENKEQKLLRLRELNQTDLAKWRAQLKKHTDKMPKKIKKAGFINFEMNSDIVLAKNDIGKDEMNLVMSYTYKTNGINSKGLLYDYDYDIHNYRLKNSEACRLLCDFIDEMFNKDLKDYIVDGNKITINITYTTDAATTVMALPYNKKNAVFNNVKIKVNGEDAVVSVSESTGITNNIQLGFLRMKGVEDYISDIKALKNTDNSYNLSYNDELLSYVYRDMNVEIIIHDAYAVELK